MDIHSLQDTSQNQQELYVFIGGFTGIQHIHAVVRGDGPVIMFAGSVHACKGLLIQQAP